jgi:hypothetical protein
VKPYGLSIEEYPDVGDIKSQGRKSSVGTIKSKGGEYRGYHRNKTEKARVRRYYKRKARNNWKQEVEGQLRDDEALREELEVEEYEYDEFYKGLDDEWYDTFKYSKGVRGKWGYY